MNYMHFCKAHIDKKSFKNHRSNLWLHFKHLIVACNSDFDLLNLNGYISIHQTGSTLIATSIERLYQRECQSEF